MTRLGHTYVDCQVSIDDIVDELTDDQVRQICKDRGILTGQDAIDDRIGRRAQRDDLVGELRDTMRAGDRRHFEILLLQASEAAGFERLHIPSGMEKAGKPT